MFSVKYCASRVARAIYDDELCFVCDVRSEIWRHEILGGWSPHRAGAGVCDTCVVGDPCRVKQYCFIPFVQNCLDSNEDRLFCAGCHKDLIGCDGNAVICV